ncbi:MAG: exodeoxyribonuclease III [Pseudanabaenaceae cyanobacterium]|jgi:exodeoxyribonuclease-3
MQIATWNVNSIRTRLSQVQQWLGSHPEVTVLCVQETKVVDQDFPLSAFQAEGYHVYIYGQKAYNGVALISRVALEDVQLGFGAILTNQETDDPEVSLRLRAPNSGHLDDQKRIQTAVIASDFGLVRLVNMYVPNGSAVDSDKYHYKLQWLETLKVYLERLRLIDTARYEKPLLTLLCGDFNIAISDLDIHDPKGRENHIMATATERQALTQILELGFYDAFRKFEPNGGHFSWWDYRAGGFQRNRGWRIDYHFLSEALYTKATSCIIDKTPRTQEQPSDHVPVIVGFD